MTDHQSLRSLLNRIGELTDKTKEAIADDDALGAETALDELTENLLALTEIIERMAPNEPDEPVSVA